MQEKIEFYNAKQLADILGICYAKALVFIKYSGIAYVKINRTYLVEKSTLKNFISKTRIVDVTV